jgi:hypothetical protein
LPLPSKTDPLSAAIPDRAVRPTSSNLWRRAALWSPHPLRYVIWNPSYHRPRRGGEGAGATWPWKIFLRLLAEPPTQHCRELEQPMICHMPLFNAPSACSFLKLCMFCLQGARSNGMPMPMENFICDLKHFVGGETCALRRPPAVRAIDLANHLASSKSIDKTYKWHQKNV